MAMYYYKALIYEKNFQTTLSDDYITLLRKIKNSTNRNESRIYQCEDDPNYEILISGDNNRIFDYNATQALPSNKEAEFVGSVHFKQILYAIRRVVIDSWTNTEFAADIEYDWGEVSVTNIYVNPNYVRFYLWGDQYVVYTDIANFTYFLYLGYGETFVIAEDDGSNIDETEVVGKINEIINNTNNMGSTIPSLDYSEIRKWTYTDSNKSVNFYIIYNNYTYDDSDLDEWNQHDIEADRIDIVKYYLESKYTTDQLKNDFPALYGTNIFIMPSFFTGSISKPHVNLSVFHDLIAQGFNGKFSVNLYEQIWGVGGPYEEVFLPNYNKIFSIAGEQTQFDGSQSLWVSDLYPDLGVSPNGIDEPTLGQELTLAIETVLAYANDAANTPSEEFINKYLVSIYADPYHHGPYYYGMSSDFKPGDQNIIKFFWENAWWYVFPEIDLDGYIDYYGTTNFTRNNMTVSQLEGEI